MALDIVRFPDPIGALIGLLNGQWPGLATATVPAAYTRHLLVRGTSSPATLVTQRTLYTIECRDKTSPAKAAELGQGAAAFHDAYYRANNEPVGYELGSVVANYPDPDDGTPRSVVTCSLTWSRI